MGTTQAARTGWPFSFSVLAPIVVAILVTAGTAAGFIVWSTTRSDGRALERQTRLVSHILERELQGIGDELLEITEWDDAADALDADPRDMEFVDEYLGADLYSAYGYNRIYVLNPNLDPIYAMRDGGAVAITAYEADRRVIGALAALHRTPEGAAAIAANDNGFSPVPVVRDIAMVEGRTALIGIVPIVASSRVLEPGTEHFEVAIRFLDGAVAGELMDQYLIEGARFDSTATAGVDEAAIPLKNMAGNVVAWFNWKPDRPGAQILAETSPAMGAAILVAAIVIFFLVSRLRRSSAELELARADAHHRAMHDPLTGLANRAGFAERLTAAFAALSRDKDPFALLALDLDRFKQVNDTLGHEAGDMLLQQVADRVRPLLRDGDTLARLGGDEFSIIQQSVKNPADARMLADRVIARVSEPYQLVGSQAKIGVSIGIAVATSQADAAELPARADFALYEAKDGGRNQYRMFGDRTDNVVPIQAGSTSRVA